MCKIKYLGLLAINVSYPTNTWFLGGQTRRRIQTWKIIMVEQNVIMKLVAPFNSIIIATDLKINHWSLMEGKNNNNKSAIFISNYAQD